MFKKSFHLFVLLLLIQGTYAQLNNDLNTLLVVHDAHVRGGVNSSENYGGLGQMEIKDGSTDSFLRNIYLQFDLQEFSSISSARLLVYGSAQEKMLLSAYECSSQDWDESTITWENKPLKGDLITSNNISTELGWVELEVTGAAQSIINQGNNWFSILLGDEQELNKTIILNSKEEGIGQFRARLVVEGEKSVSKSKDVYLVIGQSNTAGRGDIEQQDEEVLGGVFLLNEYDSWEPARNPMNAYSTIRKDLDVQGLGYAYSFAKKIHDFTGDEIGLVVNARGGTSIFDWTKGSDAEYFEEAYDQLQKALSLPNTTFKGVLWHQGESNKNLQSYNSRLNTLISDLRDTLGMPDVPFVAGQLSQERAENVTFNTSILELPNLVSNMWVVTTEGLIAFDSTHFDSESQRQLGFRYADAILGFTLVENDTYQNVYYIDDEFGDDSNSGYTRSTAWKTLANVNTTIFLPGDQILFKAGGSWSGAIMPNGSGTSLAPITIGRYSSGANPIINGEGKVSCSINSNPIIYCTIHLANQEYWEVHDLEIVNYDVMEEGGLSLEDWENSNTTIYADVDFPPAYKGDNSYKCGVLIEANNYGAVNHLHFNNLEIHGVNGNIHDKDNGGIFIEIFNYGGSQTPTYFNDLLVDSCYIHDVDRTGISNHSAYSDRSIAENENWIPSTNFHVKNTRFEKTGANALIMRVADKPLLENCVFDHCSIKESGNAAFFFNADCGIMQFNEFMYTKANIDDRDAGGPDIDFRTKSCFIQYNYIHDNDFGLLVTGGADPDSDRFNDSAVVRYNVIERDGKFPHPSDGKFVLKTSGNTTRTIFHNNVIYIDEDQDDTKIAWNKKWSGASADFTSYHNNIIYNLGTNTYHDYGDSRNNIMSHNLYYGNSIDPADGETDILVGDPLFVAAGDGPEGYRISEGSPTIGEGVNVVSIPSLDYFGGEISYNGPIDIGVHQLNSKIVGVDDHVGGLAFDIFPNPVKEQLHVSGAEGGIYELIDQTGRIYTSGKIDSRTHFINTSYLSEGVYMLKVTLDGQSIIQKVFKSEY